MKITKIAQFTVVAVALMFALPGRAETMSVPTAENTAFTLEVPSGWKPKGDAKDESVEATSADEHAYLSAWMVVTSDPKAEEQYIKDLSATLKDSLKSIDDASKQEPFEANGATGVVVKGSGIDKRAGTKVKFRVVLFPAGKDQVGIVYTDYDADAPQDTMTVLEGILKSIKVAAPKKEPGGK